MGDLRFQFPETRTIDPRVWETAYITGIDGIAWQCHHRLQGDQFSIGRDIEESGRLNIVWPTKTAGNLCLCTTSLRVVNSSYSLPVELARGTISRLKNQTDEWLRLGLKLPPDFFPIAEQALDGLLRSLTSPRANGSSVDLAQSAINGAIQASLILCTAFADQALEARKYAEGKLSSLIGASLPMRLPMATVPEAFAKPFNMLGVSAGMAEVESSSGKPSFEAFDQQVEWATEHEMKVCVGPLVDFRKGKLPKWMVLLEEGFPNVLQAACKHATNVVERYRGRVHLWNCAAGLNTPNEMRWSDEEVLRMAVSLIETVRRADDRTPVLLTINQPWSEYLRDHAEGISPLHFADALIRADLGLSGLVLELDFDVWPGGSFARDPIELSRLVDRWAMLGLPLMISLSTPSDSHDVGTCVSAWESFEPAGVVPPELLIKLLLSKPSVHAVIWNHLSDQLPSEFHCGGLLDRRGKSKPLLSKLHRLRATYLH